MSDDALIVFTPSGRRGRFPKGTPVLAAARALGVDIDSVCGGRGICGRCQIEVVRGELPKFGIRSDPDRLSPVGHVETRYREARGLDEGRRLSCSATLLGDVVIDVPPDSQVHRQVVRKRPEVRAIELDPVVRLHYVEVAEPDMLQPRGDLERLFEALEAQWGLAGLVADPGVVRGLQATLRAGGWRVTAAVREGERVIALWPGFHERLYGVAFDVGSTTIACHLCDLSSGEVLASAGGMNPQIRFGEDLMSRVSYVMMNPGGDVDMTLAVRMACNGLVGEVAAEANIARGEILEATFVGNPIMHHLLLGLDPTELGGAPFALATSSSATRRCGELGLEVNENARAYVLPCVAGHVGADTAGVILSEEPHRRDDTSLIVDVGTNAEILLGNRSVLLAASSPTGPAFEGAQISCGQRAAPGAIERVRIDPATLEPRFRVIGCDKWSDEPGFEKALGRTGITGICGSGIIEAIAEMYVAGLLGGDGTIRGAMSSATPRIHASGRTYVYMLHAGPPEIMVTQGDVRAIQLAKAALHAGCRLLMDRLGVDVPDRIVLAGAFGSHIDPTHAMILGMVPDCDPSKVYAAGNAAGTGARIALLNRAARRDIEATVRQIEKVETALEPDFQSHFVEAMAIPHASAPYANLSRAVTLPPRTSAQPHAHETGEGRRRRRERGARHGPEAAGPEGQG